MTYKSGSWGAEAKERSAKRKQYFREYKKKRNEKKPLFIPKGCIKRNARQRVRDHLLAGKITKPSSCEECLLVTKLEAHHKDYSKPLEVNWLCKSCHVKADKLISTSIV